MRAVAPGRVNLIGEHIDYNGFSVLPCAISKTVSVSGVIDDDSDFLFSVESDKFQGRNFRQIELSSHWTDYPLAAFSGILKISGKLPKIKIKVEGNIPIAAGLSSSSALVVACALVICRLANLDIPRVDLAVICAECEKLAGTAGGGMDQAVILLAERGFAMHVEFFPKLRATPVAVPGIFLAANSQVVAAKATEAAKKFNRRVLECKIAAQILGGETLNEAMRGRSFEEMLEISSLIPDEVNPDDVKFAEMDSRMQAAIDSAKKSGEKLKIKARARHVFSEARRVEKFIKAAAAGDTAEMGNLMNQSHESCAVDFECSCPELDKLVKLMRQAGALGARLTGAGWGGFAIALVPAENLEKVKETLKQEFYSGQVTEEILFEFQPSGGAQLFC